MSKTLSGVIAAVATPVGEDDAPDLKRAVKLARFLLDNGCDGLNVLGTTGEATSFSLDERKNVMDAYKANGLPLEPPDGGNRCTPPRRRTAVALTRHAAALGCRRRAGAAAICIAKAVCRTTVWSPISTPLVEGDVAQKPSCRSTLYHFPATVRTALWHVSQYNPTAAGILPDPHCGTERLIR